MPTAKQIFDQKDKFLEKREQVLNRKVTAAEKKLLNVIIEKFIDKLETDNGVIRNNNTNIQLTQELEQIFEEFDKSINKGIILGYIDDIRKGQALNERYFGFFEEDKDKLGNIKKRVQSTVNRRLGITNNGGVKRKGFLDNFIQDNRVKTGVQELVTQAITGQQSKSEATAALRTLVAGNNEVSGQLSSQYRTLLSDTYQQVDNLESSLYAEAIGMDAAFYAGGTISTTRKFCCQRNGLLFTVEEIKEWKSLRFQGKPKNYNPLTDMGGYNCRHRFRYVSNKIAVRRRKDLMIDNNGKLVKRPGVATQKYHQGCS